MTATAALSTVKEHRIAEVTTLAWLIIALIAALLPHLPYLPVWIQLTGFAIAAWRLHVAWRGAA